MAVTPPAVQVHYWDELHDAKMGAAISRMTQYQFFCDSMNLYKISSFTGKLWLNPSRRSDVNAEVEPSSEFGSDKNDPDAVVVDIEDDFQDRGELMTTTKLKESGLQRKNSKLQTKCW